MKGMGYLFLFAQLFLSFLLSLTKWGKKRIAFEKKNTESRLSESFSLINLQADFAYHCSSEGEWEQIRIDVQNKLAKGCNIEIIFTSPSVEKGILKFAHDIKFPDSLRLLRLPILTSSFFSPYRLHRWITAKDVVLVRYDFFPELLGLIFFEKKLHLVWATTKKLKIWNLLIFSFFKTITPSTQIDFEYLRKFYPQKILNPKESRIPAILERLSHKQETLEERFPSFTLFSNWIKLFPLRLIIGSAWKEDVSFLPIDESFYQNRLVVIVPHDLNLNWAELMSSFSHLYFIKPETTQTQMIKILTDYKNHPAPIVILIKGILCELYAEFPMAFVGGGFGKSVHSLLEPYLSNSMVFCGPKVHRSTEADVIDQNDKNRLLILNKPMDMMNYL
jgi:3-deoxy-D-manno-octulosonic-acid transferase